MLEVAVEQAKLLRSRLERETTRYNNLHERVTELETTRQQLQRDVEEKCIHVRFLEDERQLFKDMADNLRAGLLSLGSAGQHIVKQMSRGRYYHLPSSLKTFYLLKLSTFLSLHHSNIIHCHTLSTHPLTHY